MFNVKITDIIKNFKLFALFRKYRNYLHYKSSYHKARVFIKHYGGGLINRIDEHHVFLLAGGLAFSIFICIIPFMLIMFYILGNILDSTNMQLQVNAFIETIIPYSKYAEFVRNIIFTRINEVIEYKNIAGIIGAFGLFFAASGLFSSMRTILNRVFDIETNVHFLIGKLKDFALVLMVILIFFVATVLTPVIDFFRQAAQNFESLNFLNLSIFGHLLFSLVSLIIIFIVFAILYVTVPIRKLGKHATLISALWASILWEGAKQIFGYYLHHFTTFGRIYGTYALVIVVAFWIYYSSIVFIIGAEIGRLYTERKNLEEDNI
ncbi:MAG TPA: YihY/virulence factor BrkB family protein [Ignavibacteria bacterium]|nr:YihY/virulence factor BrkB family protein [Ignavibacteria bacterium]